MHFFLLLLGNTFSNELFQLTDKWSFNPVNKKGLANTKSVAK